LTVHFGYSVTKNQLSLNDLRRYPECEAKYESCLGLKHKCRYGIVSIGMVNVGMIHTSKIGKFTT